MTDRLSTLLAWCSSNGISIQPSISLLDVPDAGITVRSYEDIPLHTIVASIPKSAILSVRSSVLAHSIPPAPYGHSARLALALALYAEILTGPTSRFYGYLQSLPARTVPIALLWGSADAHLDTDSRSEPISEDSREAKEWINGTEVEKEFFGDDDGELMGEIRTYFETVVRTLLSDANVTFADFLRAYSLVSSRAFLVDAYHGLAMVPIADAFNHSNENQVHLESDFDVCPTCGSLAECIHDRENISSSVPSNLSPSAIPIAAPSPSNLTRTVPIRTSPSVEFAPDTVDMVTTRPIPAHTEVFNTYGTYLGSAALLAQYGFALEGGEGDGVGWNWEELVTGQGEDEEMQAEFPMLEDKKAMETMFRRLVGVWRQSRWALGVDDSSLVYVPAMDSEIEPESGAARRRRLEDADHMEVDGLREESPEQVHLSSSDHHPGPSLILSGSRSLLRVNSDAQISVQLWLYVALRTILAVLASSTVSVDGEEDDRVARITLAGDVPDPRSGDWLAMVRFLGEVVALQAGVEKVISEPEREGVPGDEMRNAGVAVRLIMSRMARLIAALCRAKKARIGRYPEMSTAQLGEILDSLPEDRPKTRMAITHVLTERMVLESCEAAWKDLELAVPFRMPIVRRV
ncbi:SET domain-containing protein [Laetiporus sulphureus 93-53]|uniref:SET domain-containing protein n=1 Tax=Laetiporus sulphureus 93-53 TaxID=1314785 RepID=A0A165INA7_9APHY|nr:SET domain-containing protein [Laetiporus sulphureus 93-53]KZT13317.1 SET domain-containing protein [Laetiporus sulphureus 93-53]